MGASVGTPSQTSDQCTPCAFSTDRSVSLVTFSTRCAKWRIASNPVKWRGENHTPKWTRTLGWNAVGRCWKVLICFDYAFRFVKTILSLGYLVVLTISQVVIPKWMHIISLQRQSCQELGGLKESVSHHRSKLNEVLSATMGRGPWDSWCLWSWPQRQHAYLSVNGTVSCRILLYRAGDLLLRCSKSMCPYIYIISIWLQILFTSLWLLASFLPKLGLSNRWGCFRDLKPKANWFPMHSKPLADRSSCQADHSLNAMSARFKDHVLNDCRQLKPCCKCR